MTVSLLRKIISTVLGAIFCLALFEGGLRLGGFLVSTIQEQKNLQAIKEKGSYRILCLGESTTQGQYPQPLERILNGSSAGVRFNVIDKGKVGTNTDFILDRIESYLNEYHPDMVVAMMGNNDSQITYYEDIPESDAWFFRHSRVYRFLRLLYAQFLKKVRGEDIYGMSGRNPNKAKLGGAWSIVEKAAFASEVSAEDPSKSPVFIPKTDQDYLGLGQKLCHEGRNPSEAEAAFRKAIELNPKNEEAYLELGRLYRIQDKMALAEESFRKAIAINPECDMAYHALGWVYTDLGKRSEAEAFFRKSIVLRSSKTPKFEPNKTSYYIEQADQYVRQNDLTRAEAILKQGLQIKPNDKCLYKAMASLYGEMGRPEAAKEYANKAGRLGPDLLCAATVRNYHKLKTILDSKGIRLVCVQYPMRNVEPLQQIFRRESGVIFVDNKKLFEDAVKKEGYQAYFKDMFAGDFGHCTKKGNELLAQNIAGVILKEVFNQR